MKFFISIFMALPFLLRGQDMPPMPPNFPVEKVITQPTPEHILHSPRSISTTPDAAMVSVLWDYSVPQGGEVRSPVASPKGAETLSTAMAVLPPGPTTNYIIEQTVSWTYTNYANGEIVALVGKIVPNSEIHVSTNCVDWASMEEGECQLSSNIAIYFATNRPKSVLFKAVPPEAAP